MMIMPILAALNRADLRNMPESDEPLMTVAQWHAYAVLHCEFGLGPIGLPPAPSGVCNVTAEQWRAILLEE
jgi:hypothetical protein